MQIEDVHWLAAEQSVVSAMIDGMRLSIPADPDNRHYQMLLAWIEAGNTIAPFVPPQE